MIPLVGDLHQRLQQEPQKWSIGQVLLIWKGLSDLPRLPYFPLLPTGTAFKITDDELVGLKKWVRFEAMDKLHVVVQFLRGVAGQGELQRSSEDVCDQPDRALQITDALQHALVDLNSFG